MHKKIASRFALLGAISFAAAPAGAVEFETDSGWKMQIRGFVSADVDYDERDMGGSEPLFPPRKDSAAADRSTLRFSSNQTQIGFGIEAPAANGLSNRAYIEFDFLNASVPERSVTANPRLRHAYWSLGWDDRESSLLIGQTNVLFGDLLPDLTFDNLNLALGSLFGRETQIRYTRVNPLSTDSDWNFAVSLNSPNSGFFNEATGTAERTSAPFVHGRIAYRTNARGRADYFGFQGGSLPMEFALSGFFGQEEVDRTGGGTATVDAWGLAISGVVPLVGIRDGQRAGALSIMGQAWIGQNMDSYFGGNGQGIYETAAGDVDGIEGRGFFVGGKYFFSDRVWINAIYSYEENDLDDLVRAGTPFRIASGLFSDAVFAAPGVGDAENVNLTLWFNPLNALYTGIGWDYRKASYNDGVDGDNNRINLSLFYNF
jgi:hypothetical protein